MKKWVFPCIFVLLAAGCTFTGKQSLHEVRLVSGERLYAENNPTLKDDFYEFYDVNDQKYVINRSLVLYVEPAEFSR